MQWIDVIGKREKVRKRARRLLSAGLLACAAAAPALAHPHVLSTGASIS